MTFAAAQPNRPASQAAAGRFKVMVIDDSAVVRGQLVRALDADPEIEVLASVSNGELALKSLAQTPVDIIVLDIEMPVMDGMTALPLLLKADPNVRVIMASTLTRVNAQVSLEALAKGASDYIAKPRSSGVLRSADDFKRELVEKVKALAVSRRGPVRGKTATEPAVGTAAKKSLYANEVALRAPGTKPPHVLAIGSSTGGPQALLQVLGDLRSAIKLPVLITQHMPATFTTILAEHLAKATGLPAAEATDGEVLTSGRIYVAPGDYHMVVERKGVERAIRLNQGPRENFCRPAVDPMLCSLATTYGGNVLTVILTGMGHDGRDGCKAIVEAGGTVVAQDEESSVVWGMPGAVATAGLCSAVLPMPRIAPHVAQILKGGAR